MIISKKKKILLAGIGALIIIAVAAMLLARPASAQQTPRTREYPASTGTITVGVDATGSITSNKKRQMSNCGIKLDEYKVKKGELVTKGDIIATLLKSDIEEKLDTAKQELKNAEFELNKAKKDKEAFINEADQKLAQTRGSAQNSYTEKAEPVKAKINAAQAQINEKAAKIKTLEEEIKRYEEEKAKNEPNAPDYDALIAEAKAQIDKLNTEIQALKTEISGLNAQLGSYNSELERSQREENTSVDNQKNQNGNRLSEHDNLISNASEKYKAASEKFNLLNELLKNPQITAENSGVVMSLGFAPGAEINTSAPVIETGAEEDMYLELLVDAIDFADITEGQEVSFYVDAYPDATFSGKVKSKTYIQNENGKFGITVSLNQSEYELYNGMGASATLIIKQVKDVLTLQNKAIFIENGKQYVNIKNAEGNLEKREIKTGFSDGRVTEVTSGLQDGDIAIIEEKYENS